MISTKDCYQQRFNLLERRQKNKAWGVLCSCFFQKYIEKNDVVMDIGAGYCEFINHLRCGQKIAVDINPDTSELVGKDVEVVKTSAVRIPKKFNDKIDKILMSNFLEHLNSKEEVLAVLRKAHQLLKLGGRILILQPNIDLVKEKYWNFFDHKIPLNEMSLREALEISDFKIEKFIKRFLPYTTKTRLLPKAGFLIRFYLKLPCWLRPWAGQSLVVARKNLDETF